MLLPVIVWHSIHVPDLHIVIVKLEAVSIVSHLVVKAHELSLISPIVLLLLVFRAAQN